MNDVTKNLHLVDDADPILHTAVDNYVFDDIESKTAAFDIANKLGESLIKFGGVGVSACQIGISARAFAIRTDPVLVCFNPKIVDSSDEQVVLDEGCLSYPGVHIKIKRARHIRLRFQTPYGETDTQKFTGITARAILHEIDHLNGIVFLKYAKPVARQLAMKKLKKAKSIRALRQKFQTNNS